MNPLKILVLGAAYGLLPAMRILTAGHRVTVVCRPEEQSALIEHGARVTFKATGQSLQAIATQGHAPDGVLGVTDPYVDISEIDLVVLAMSEPHYGAPEITALMQRIAVARLPVLSISNAPPPPFLKRLEKIDINALKQAYLAWDAWQGFDPSLVSSASPDAQAVRRNPERSNELTVTLGSNFKAAPFARAQDQALLERLAADVAATLVDGKPCSVRIVAHTSLHAPLAKWPMLLTGNCRCLVVGGKTRSIAEAVRSNLDESRRIYEWALELVQKTGADMSDLVPFRHYAAVSKRLIAPSSFARAVDAGAPQVERVDKIIQLTGRSLGMSLGELDAIVKQADTFEVAL